MLPESIGFSGEMRVSIAGHRLRSCVRQFTHHWGEASANSPHIYFR
jgi:hypothetical protein